MEIGIDSFASAMYGNVTLNSVDAMEQLIERIVVADEAGLDVFGIGEHHRKEFLDSATAVILAAAAGRTKRTETRAGPHVGGGAGARPLCSCQGTRRTATPVSSKEECVGHREGRPSETTS